jgi:hypothetical protein
LRFRPSHPYKSNELLNHMQFHFKSGTIPALYDALDFLIGIGLSAPEWVLQGALQVTADRLKEGASIGKGSSGNERIKFQRQLIPYWRWRAYQKVRDEGTPEIDAYEEASKRLEGTFARGNADAIEKSIDKFIKRYKRLGQNSVYLPFQSSMLAGTPVLNLAMKTKSKTK